MEKERTQIYNIINIMDIISMLMILFYHCACYQQIITGYMNPYVYTIISFFVNFGLTAFTFSSGFKQSFNHYLDFNDNDFFTSYLSKRSWHLYKIYLIYPFVCAIIYFILNILNLTKHVQPYIAHMGAISIQSLFDWFLGSVPPVGGHLWFLFVLCLINIIALFLLKSTKIYGILIVFLFLLFYFLACPHTLTAICLTELPYYVLLYLIIYLSGLLMGFLYHFKKQYFEIGLAVISSIFIIVIALFYLFEILKVPFPNNTIFIQLYHNIFLKYGLTYPCFLMSVLYLFRKCSFLRHLSFLKQDTLYIYLLQYPFVIPLFTRLLINLNVKHTTIITIDSFLLSLITCILLHRLIDYLVLKAKHLKTMKPIK